VTRGCSVDDLSTTKSVYLVASCNHLVVRVVAAVFSFASDDDTTRVATLLINLGAAAASRRGLETRRPTTVLRHRVSRRR